MEKKLNVIEKTFLFVVPFVLVGALVIYLIWGNKDYTTSFILGGASSLLMNSLNYRVLKDAFAHRPDTIKKKTIWLYILRFVFYGIILYIANTTDGWNIYSVFVGILSYRIVLVPIALYYAKKEGDQVD